MKKKKDFWIIQESLLGSKYHNLEGQNGNSLYMVVQEKMYGAAGRSC